MQFRPKDYVASDDGLLFAVVSDRIEQGRVLTYLRYKKQNATLAKLSTIEAAAFIKQHRPDLIFHSTYADIELHGLPTTAICKHYRPEQTVPRLLNKTNPDHKQQTAIEWIELLLHCGLAQDSIGITGSLMLDSHHAQSDIDVVIYGRAHFVQCIAAIKQQIGMGKLAMLEHADLMASYLRRDCELDFQTYADHQQQKYNQYRYGDTKVDLSLIPTDDEKVAESGPYKKLGHKTIRALIVDDTYSYDFPARYVIKHDTIYELVAYTATYTGQATIGDTVEAAGYIEQDQNGIMRLVVGTSREAKGQYIKRLT